MGGTGIGARREAQYDAQAKRLLGQKIILGHILIRTIDEFRGMAPEEAAGYIEGTPYIGQLPVEPGLTNRKEGNRSGRVAGFNTESSEINEGVVRFDIVFYIRMKDGLSQIIVNVEAQKDQPEGYAVLNRGLYYVSRLVSSQKERDFEKSDFDSIKSVYSIWICLNMPENSFSHVHLVQERQLGSSDWPGKLDMMNVILIGIARELPGKEKEYELHRLLGALLSSELTVDEKLSIMEMEYRIPVEDNVRKEVIDMCNLGQGVREQGVEIGVKNEKIATIYRMHKKGYSLDMIVDVTEKTPEEVKAILSGEEL